VKQDYHEIKLLLDEKAAYYNQPRFITYDPIAIPRCFEEKADIEIMGLFSALLAWGNRKSIIRSGERLMNLFHQQPHEFITNASEKDLRNLKKSTFVHRTFNATDLSAMVAVLGEFYRQHPSLEELFLPESDGKNYSLSITRFHDYFAEHLPEKRTLKHLSNPASGSASKRICMFLRWMVRTDDGGVDFGIWKRLKPSRLSIPLDVHSGSVARNLGLLQRKQNDWKAVEELDVILRSFDPTDPVKYDFALFGLGAFDGKEF
jgi:uncharacterized protein (TIGR02757 family)